MAENSKLRKRELVAAYVACNWRVRQRLPRITQLATKMGWISKESYYKEMDLFDHPTDSD